MSKYKGLPRGMLGKQHAESTKDKISKKKQKYEINSNFFSKMTPKSAYVLGFFVSDGNAYQRMNRLTFTQNNDKILKKIRESIKSNKPIYVEKQTGNWSNGRERYYLSIQNRKIYKDVQNLFDVSLENKSLTITYPKIPSKFDSSFIRGVFDGDGTIGRNSTTKQLLVRISGNKKLLETIQEKLIKNCDVSKTKIRKDKSIWALSYTGNIQVPRIMRWLYSDKSNLWVDSKVIEKW